ncbi:hypothetical protein [Robertmurraya sp. Marseille-Q9965]
MTERSLEVRPEEKGTVLFLKLSGFDYESALITFPFYCKRGES